MHVCAPICVSKRVRTNVCVLACARACATVCSIAGGTSSPRAKPRTKARRPSRTVSGGTNRFNARKSLFRPWPTHRTPRSTRDLILQYTSWCTRTTRGDSTCKNSPHPRGEHWGECTRTGRLTDAQPGGRSHGLAGGNRSVTRRHAAKHTHACGCGAPCTDTAGAARWRALGPPPPDR